jgi:hypothetical protein
MAETAICSITGCGKKPHNGGAMCSMHQARVRTHGSPHLGAFKPKGNCTLDGCERTHFGKGYCVKHYKRWAKYGDPLAGSTEHGAAWRFIEAAATSQTDACIIYPFYRNQEGYGWMRVKGGTGNIGAHVQVAILANGSKPSPKHEACHTCGKGHEGCVNPSHIYWGTRSDNVKDAYRHGTAFAGKHIKRRPSPAALPPAPDHM